MKFVTKNTLAVLLLTILILLTVWMPDYAIYFLPSLFLFSFLKAKNSKVQLSVIDLLFVILILAEFIVYYHSIYRPNTLLYLFHFSIFVSTYFYVRLNIESQFQKNQVFTIIVSIICLLAISTVVKYILFKHHWNMVGFTDMSDFRNLFEFNGYVNNEWVTIFLCFIPFVLYLLYECRNRKVLKVVMLIVLLLFIHTVLISFSKGTIISLFFLTIITIILLWKYKIFPIKKLLIFSFSIAIFSATLMMPYYDTMISGLLFHKSTSQMRSIEGRLNIYKGSLKIFHDYKYTGVGSNNFPLTYTVYKTNENDTQFTGRLPNLFLQILVEKGILGIFSYGLMFATLLILVAMQFRSDQKRKKVLAIMLFACFLALLMREVTFSSLFGNKVLYILIGIIIAIHANETYKFHLHVKKTIVIVTITLPVLFLIYYHYTIYSGRVYNTSFIQSVERDLINEAADNIKSAVKINPKNALYHAHNGFILARESISGDVKDICSLIADESNKQSIKNSLNAYKQSIFLNPYDELPYLNTGWLYFCLQEKDSSVCYMRKCISMEPTLAIYHLSLGMCFEYYSNIDSALCYYKNAIKLSPDILDSQFFEDFSEKQKDASMTIVNSAKNELLEEYNKTNSVIVYSKLINFYNHLDNKDSALMICNYITEKMPNLNRPWYYKALLQKEKSEMINDFKKSISLDPSDYLPKFALAQCMHETGDVEAEESYYFMALKRWLMVKSDHSKRSNKIYFDYTVSNDFAIKSLLKYCKPKYKLIDAYEKSAKILNGQNSISYYENFKYFQSALII